MQDCCLIVSCYVYDINAVQAIQGIGHLTPEISAPDLMLRLLSF